MPTESKLKTYLVKMREHITTFCEVEVEAENEEEAEEMGRDQFEGQDGDSDGIEVDEVELLEDNEEKDSDHEDSSQFNRSDNKGDTKCEDAKPKGGE